MSVWLSGQILTWPVQGPGVGIQHFKNEKPFRSVCWYTSVIPELTRLRQEDCEHVRSCQERRKNGSGRKRKKH